jgi:ankyrin repeat protein
MCTKLSMENVELLSVKKIRLIKDRFKRSVCEDRVEDVSQLSTQQNWLIKNRLWQAAVESRVDDVSRFSTHFAGDVYTLNVALKTACQYGQLNVVTWLVEHTVLRDDGKRLGEALVEACRSGHWNIVKWLVYNAQVDVNNVSVENNKILHHVISFNNNNLMLQSTMSGGMTDLCRRVYMCGEDVNMYDNGNRDTLLHWACEYKSDIVGALLLAGADETIANDNGLTPVQWAAKRGRQNILPLLDVSSEWKLLVRSHRLRRRTAVRVMMTLVKWKVQQTRAIMWTRTSFTEAAYEGRVDDVSQLSTHFAGDVYTLNVALKTACQYGQLNVVTWLVEHTVLRDDGERLGEALVEACRSGHWNIVKWLVYNTQVDVNCADFSGNSSILHRIISFNIDNLLTQYATIRDLTKLCTRVYLHGEDVNVQNNDGCTPLHWACFYESADSICALLLAGACETIANDDGQTPIQWAAKRGRLKMLPMMDVSSKWKLLVRSHRLRRRTAVRVMMTLIRCKVKQTRRM